MISCRPTSRSSRFGPRGRKRVEENPGHASPGALSSWPARRPLSRSACRVPRRSPGRVASGPSDGPPRSALELPAGPIERPRARHRGFHSPLSRGRIAAPRRQYFDESVDSRLRLLRARTKASTSSGFHRRAVSIQHADRDPVGRPAARHPFVPRLVEVRNGQRLVRDGRGTGSGRTAGNAAAFGGLRPSRKAQRSASLIVGVESIEVAVAVDRRPAGLAALQRAEGTVGGRPAPACSKRFAASSRVIGPPRSSKATIRSE